MTSVGASLGTPDALEHELKASHTYKLIYTYCKAKYRMLHAGHVTVTNVTHLPLLPICPALQSVSYKMF